MQAIYEFEQALAPEPARPAASLRQYEGSQYMPCPSNAQLCVEVRLALLRACPSIAFDIEIIARDGVVQLRGSVASERKLVQLYRAARTVPGIHWVCNDVTVDLAMQRLRFEFDTMSGLAAAA